MCVNVFSSLCEVGCGSFFPHCSLLSSIDEAVTMFLSDFHLHCHLRALPGSVLSDWSAEREWAELNRRKVNKTERKESRDKKIVRSRH